MELLEIQNFLTIRQAKLDVRRFTILIGPQANGKSVVAKLLYFFRNFLAKQFIQSIRNQETKRQLEQQAIAYFEQIFPRYAWSYQKFELSYSINDVKIFLRRQGQSAKPLGLKFDYSKDLAEIHREAKNHYRYLLKAIQNTTNAPSHLESVLFDMMVDDDIYDSPLRHNFQDSVFIPASRSFFANLQKNVFSFLANNIAIDPLIKEFGSVYESSKTLYDRRLQISDEGPNRSSLREVKQEIEKILAGQYIHEDNQDWIISGKRKINLANASSGQQEVLPLLLVLFTWPYYISKVPSTFFIEEPEAHLFPVSQRRLIGIFSRLYKTFKYKFILTTHSPYILTALNNLIMASNLAEEKKEKLNGEIKKVIGADEPIRFEDVGAYTIENGVLKSILNQETRLIGSSIIDSVSDEFDRVFDKLMAIELS